MSTSHVRDAAVRPESFGRAQPTREESAAASAVYRMICGVHISRAMYVMAELGIAELLANGPMTTTQLAQATKAHEPWLYRVLRLLASLGILTEHDNRAFSLTILGERLRADVPASMLSWAKVVESIGGMKSFEPIVDAVKTGRPGFDLAYGMGVFEFLTSHPEKEHQFQAAMSERTAAVAPSVAAEYDFSRLRSVADIGGGKGTLLAAILQVHSHLQGILFDLPSVVDTASDVLWAAGVADRCEIVPGDMFQGVRAGADAYLLANVLHDWDDTDAVRILVACREAMGHDGRVLIVERLIPDNPGDALPALLSDFNMLIFSGGQERTNAEYGRLLREAGLSLTKVRPAAPPYGIIEGCVP